MLIVCFFLSKKLCIFDKFNIAVFDFLKAKTEQEEASEKATDALTLLNTEFIDSVTAFEKKNECKVSSSQACSEITINDGTIVIVGFYGGSFSISLPLIPMRSINIKGSYVGELRELKELVELINSKNVELIKVTKQDLNTANDAMKKLRNGDVDGRIVLEP